MSCTYKIDQNGLLETGLLVWYSKYAAWRQGLSNQDQFKLDYTQYNNVVVIFGVELFPFSFATDLFFC